MKRPRQFNKYRNCRVWSTADLGSCVTQNPNDPAYCYAFRSRLEFTCARVLETRTRARDYRKWEYEPETWTFRKKDGEKYDKNNRYIPDFRVIRKDGTVFYIEAKGYPTPDALVKINRAIKHYPDKELLIYTGDGSLTPAAQWLARWRRK